jgi:single-strand DNA-binding protein
MAQGDTVVTVVGNITGDPELRFTPSGQAVANFSIASTPRVFDRSTNEFKDGETLFMRCSIWRDAAENVAESLKRGYRVIATGRLKQRSYDDNEGNKRTVVEMEVDEIGPSLKFVTASINRAQRQQAGQAQQGDDPWATPPQQPPQQAQQQPWSQQQGPAPAWGQPAQGPSPQQGPPLPPPGPRPVPDYPVEDPPY